MNEFQGYNKHQIFRFGEIIHKLKKTRNEWKIKSKYIKIVMDGFLRRKYLFQMLLRMEIIEPISISHHLLQLNTTLQNMFANFLSIFWHFFYFLQKDEFTKIILKSNCCQTFRVFFLNKFKKMRINLRNGLTYVFEFWSVLIASKIILK